MGREKNRDYFAYKYIQSKESYYLLNEILNKYNQNDPKWHSPINLGKLGNEFHRPFLAIKEEEFLTYNGIIKRFSLRTYLKLVGGVSGN